jgi:hypothetical protein
MKLPASRKECSLLHSLNVDITLLALIREKDTLRLDYLRYNYHTQTVEGLIELDTEASEVVCGSEKRDGFIRARLESR